MIKKLGLLLCLAFAAQTPMNAGYYGKNSRNTAVEIAKVSAGAACVVGTICLIAAYPKFFGEFAGALLRAFADHRYCYDCGRHYYGHHQHVTVTTTYTTVY